MLRYLLAPCLLLLSGSAAEAQSRLRYNDWQLVFREDFDTYRDVADMMARSPWQFTPDSGPTLVGNPHEDEYYHPAAISLRDGHVYLTARPLPEPRTFAFRVADRDTLKQLHFESGWLSLKPEFGANTALGDTARWPGNRGFQYGLFEIRCRLGGGAGTWPAFWLYSGPTEIDVFEGADLRRFSNNVHDNTGSTPNYAQQSYRLPLGKRSNNGFHVYSVVWTPVEVTFYLNRRRLRTVPASRIPTAPALATIIVNQAVVASANPASWPTDAQGPYSSLVVDYIKVYKLRAALPTSTPQTP